MGSQTATQVARRVSLLACAAIAVVTAGCTSSSTSDEVTPTSVPTSAAVAAPRGQTDLSATGTPLTFGESAVLPAHTFAATGPHAMFTVTGITPAEGVPDDATNGGTAYFFYVTVTSLSTRPASAPDVFGLSASADGKTPALTFSPTPGLPDCPASTPPEQMRRGESYSTCLVSVADRGQRLQRVIYWADTAGQEALDYKSAPVVWSPAGLPASASPSAGPAAG